MLFNYIRFLKLFFYLWLFYLWLFFALPLHALSVIDGAVDEKISILESSEIYIDNHTLSVEEVIQKKAFQPYTQSHLNRGVSQQSVWIKFQLQNSENRREDKVLFLSSPLLESIELYKETMHHPRVRGVAVEQPYHTTIAYHYNIHLAPLSPKTTYYLRVQSTYTPLDFSLTLQNEEAFLAEDRIKQFINILLMGVLIALMLYALGLAFYTQDKSYFYYSLYLFMIIYQQLTYVGLTQIYFSYTFIVLDMKLAIVKVGALMLTSALFSIHFLKTKQIPWLDWVYKCFLVLIVAEMVILSFPQWYNLEIVVLTGALFITFNFVAGMLIYQNGHKEARLFIVGFGVVFISYMLMILNALGVLSVIHYFPNILMWSSAIEALVLSLAFADRYKLLQEAKEKVDKEILESFQSREKVIQNEVTKKTAQLNKALKTKELLLKEVHHRVKNNLQIILSMVRLQNDKISDKITSDKFIDLENRINAIAKTYTLLLPTENLDAIDMDAYIESLMMDVHHTLCDAGCDIEIETDIEVMLPLKASVYVGLIINELVTNAYKYAFDNRNGVITIGLYAENEGFILIVKDNGKGFVYNPKHQSLGLKLIHTLVHEQLKGSIEMLTKGTTQYTIRWSMDG